MFSKILICLMILTSLYGYKPQRISADDIHIKTVDEYIKEIFGAKAKIATAVLKHESGMKLDAVNYNCRYGGRSTFCRKGDKKKAWSVDCGLGQTNVKGTVCPQHLLTLEGNMKEVGRIYKEQGLGAWVSYTNKKYKKFL